MNIYHASSGKDLQLANSESLVNYLMAVSHFVQRTAMDKLLANGRYEKLYMGHEAYITALAGQTLSPGELAGRLNVTPQACSKVLRELQDLDLVARHSHPTDSRSALLVLTPKGEQLLRDGLSVTRDIYQQFSGITGEARLTRMLAILKKLCGLLDITPYLGPALVSGVQTRDQELILFGETLLRLSKQFHKTLVTTLENKGFRGLKPAFSPIRLPPWKTKGSGV